MPKAADAPLLETPPPQEKTQALTTVQPSADAVSMFERLAKDPAVDVDKLQKLIDMQERILAHNAESQFWEAFARMQGDLPTITEDGAISVGNTIRSRYSTNEAIQEAIRPILQKHGFALSFRNKTIDKVLRVTGILAHCGGHKETDDFDSEADSGGQMNSIQRIGSTRSYGQRYTTISLLNIVSRAPQDRDDDGRRGGNKVARTTPEGFIEWHQHLQAVAPKGWKALQAAWEVSDQKFRKAILAHEFEALKKTAVEADKAQK
jgi:hypothetical protein